MKSQLPCWREKLTSGRFWLIQIRDFTILGLLLLAISSYLQKEMVSGTAPAINATDLHANPIELTFEKPLLVYFWGSWCPVCRVTSPMVNDIATDHEVVSYAVASGTNADIQHYMSEHDFQFRVINDLASQHVLWGAETYPSFYIIDTRGQVRFVTSGITSIWGIKLRLWLSQF